MHKFIFFVTEKQLTLFLRTGKAKDPKIPDKDATAVRIPRTVSVTPDSYTKAEN